jgi:hypothetical protein
MFSKSAWEAGLGAGTFITILRIKKGKISPLGLDRGVNMCYIKDTMYLARISVRRADGTKRYYFVLRHTEWSKRERRPIQRYLGYIGAKPVLGLKRAKALAKKAGIGLDELRRVNGLRIVDDVKKGG